MRPTVSYALLTGLLTVSACVRALPHDGPATGSATGPLTHGVMAGEVTPSRAVVWARCAEPAEVTVVCRAGAPADTLSALARTAPERDLTAHVVLEHLQPARTYRCSVRCRRDRGADTGSGAVELTFATAPAPDTPAPVRFAWGGDVGGQNVCRDRDLGYPAFNTLAAQRPDFFVALGDMIYADDPCRAVGRYGNQQIPGPPAATSLPAFWAAWRYNREDPAFRSFAATTPYYAVWDDHEVANDFGPHHDTGQPDTNPGQRHLLPPGLQAFLDYNPFPPDTDTSHTLYRTVRWGRHVELFLLDTRQYRDANVATDSAAQPKSMLGAAQRAWLEERLRASGATWKIIVTSVPLAIPTGNPRRGRDGWANFDQSTGFEHELLALLRFMQRHGVRNHLWISTDVHFSAVFRHAPFADDPSFRFYEVDTGPLHAGVFPKQEFDTTLRPERVFLFPSTCDANADFRTAQTWFTFGEIRIDEAGVLTVDVVNTPGERLFTLRLPPAGA